MHGDAGQIDILSHFFWRPVAALGLFLSLLAYFHPFLAIFLVILDTLALFGHCSKRARSTMDHVIVTCVRQGGIFWFAKIFIQWLYFKVFHFIPGISWNLLRLHRELSAQFKISISSGFHFISFCKIGGCFYHHSHFFPTKN